jgi:hypothetical protein
LGQPLPVWQGFWAVEALLRTGLRSCCTALAARLLLPAACCHPRLGFLLTPAAPLLLCCCSLPAGKLTGMAFRVPTLDVSVVDLTVNLDVSFCSSKQQSNLDGFGLC